MASPCSKRILVFGATGVVGKVLVNSLLNAGDQFERIGIFTSADTAASKAETLNGFEARGAKIIIGDLYKDADVLGAYKGNGHQHCAKDGTFTDTAPGFDTVVSAVGRFAIDKQIDLIKLADESPNIIRFIPSEYGTDIAYNERSATERPHQKKLKVRTALESSDFQHLTYTYIVTGPISDLYMGNMSAEPQMGSFDVVRREATLLGDGNDRISLTSMADVGRLLVAVLKNPAFCDRKAIRVNSFTTTPHAILAELERQTESRWKVAYTSCDDLRRLEDTAWAANNPLASIYTLRRIWTEGSTLYAETDNKAIGMGKMDTLEMIVQETVKSPVAAFQSGKL